MNALELYARNWAGSEGTEMVCDIGADSDLFLDPRLCDLGSDGDRLVGPMDSIVLSEYESNVVAPAPAVADNSDEFCDGVNANTETADIISDDVRGEDIPRYGTPDFKILRSSPSSSDPRSNTPIPTNIPLPPSRLGSEDSSSEYSESVSYGADWYFDFDIEWYLFHHFSRFHRASFSFETEVEPEFSSIEIEETQVNTLIGSSLMALLDLDELDAECFGQDEKVPTQTTEEGLDVNGDDEGLAVVVYSTSGYEAACASGDTLSPGTGSSPINVDVIPVEEPIEPIKQLIQLSTIPVANDSSLLLFLSTLPDPPFPKSQPTDPPSPAQLEIFKKDLKRCTKLQIMDTITNEVGAQLRCGCGECQPVAMKALFEDWDWPWDGV